MGDANRAFEAALVETSPVGQVANTKFLDRVAWVLYVFIFGLIPFVVLIFRLDMLAWHYYLAGALFLAGALAICAINLKQLPRM